ncbi:MBL fold metallo-hydrolase [soil metagenome]
MTTSPTLQIQLMGVRGSTPAPGDDFSTVGGHTSCLAVLPDSPDGRMLVLDAGTGFRNLAKVLGDSPLRADVLLTHLHWDHMQGLPFLAQADRPDASVELWIPLAGVRLDEPGPAAAPDHGEHGDPGASHKPVDDQALELLARGFAPPSFPIRPDGLRGDWRFRALGPGPLPTARYQIHLDEVHHKGGTTLGIRVERDGRSFAYLPDHCIGVASPEQLARAGRLVQGVDVLFHGSQYLEAERATADAFGHCTARDAVDLAHRAGAGRLVLIHHAPHRDDAHIGLVLGEAAARVAELGSELSVEVGTEGLRLDL